MKPMPANGSSAGDRCPADRRADPAAADPGQEPGRADGADRLAYHVAERYRRGVGVSKEAPADRDPRVRQGEQRHDQVARPDESMLAQASAATMAASKTAALPVSVRRNWRSGVCRFCVHTVRRENGEAEAPGWVTPGFSRGPLQLATHAGRGGHPVAGRGRRGHHDRPVPGLVVLASRGPQRMTGLARGAGCHAVQGCLVRTVRPSAR